VIRALLAALMLLPAVAQAADPWPEMRHDSRNTGASPIIARYHGDRPWMFHTGRGIFSTPVIGADGTVFVGSADTYFYAIGSDGRLRWRLKTQGIIDAAGALSGRAITFGSGDERLYHVTRAGRPLWKFKPTVPPVKGQRVNWWEGNVAIGPGGNLFAGNTGGTAYAVKPSGRRLWSFTAGNSLWTTPAFAPDGSSYWGSLDLNVYHLDARGRPLWHTFTPGYVISSPAIASDRTVYVGSFDSKLYALDPATGKPRWTFPTSDHIYASPALGHDSAGRTTGVYIASTDGSVYALTPAGRLRWRYDTADPIRSSPVLGSSAHGQILYVGSSNGRLYALDANTGRRRWSFDTTPPDPLLHDRNDLNASPALGRTGVYIAGEDGFVDYVPYDYCLHRRDGRCSTNPGQDLGSDIDRIFPVSAGGNTLATTTLRHVSPATVFNLRLIVRRHGRTINAAILDPRRLVTVSPRFGFSVQESGDGHFLYVAPRGLLRAGATYRLRVAGAYTDNGSRMGNFDPAGPSAGHFATTLTVRTASSLRPSSPLQASRGRVAAFTIRRLAVPMPAFLPSVNQIGFDSYDWIASTIARTRSQVLLWVIGAFRDAHGVERVDPRSAFAFPLAGRYRGDSLSLTSPNVPLEFSFGVVPLRRFELRGDIGGDLRFRPGASVYAETVCATVPNYGPELVFTGICNPGGVLAASGTLMSAAYRGAGAARHAGVRIASVGVARGAAVVARLAGPGRPSAARHVAAVLLTDARTGQPVSTDYSSQTSVVTDAHGRMASVRLALPRGIRLPARLRAYVIIDAFPIGSRVIAGRL
jgi:outer membrane protein assembly factor BamB